MKREDSKSPETRGDLQHAPNGGSSYGGSGSVSHVPANDYDRWQSQPQPIYSNGGMQDYAPYYPSMSPPYNIQGIGDPASWPGTDMYQFSTPYGAPALNSPNSPYIDGASFGMFGGGAHHHTHHASYGFGPNFNYYAPTADYNAAWGGNNIISPGVGMEKMKPVKNNSGGVSHAPMNSVSGNLDYYGREYSSNVQTLSDGYTQFAPPLPSATHHTMPPSSTNHGIGYDGFKLEGGMAGLSLHPSGGGGGAGDYQSHRSNYNVSTVSGYGSSLGNNTGSSSGAPVKKSWAHIASQPAKPIPPGACAKRNQKVPIGNVARPTDLATGPNQNWSPAGKNGGHILNNSRSNVSAPNSNRSSNRLSGGGGTASYHHGSTVANVTGSGSQVGACDPRYDTENSDRPNSLLNGAARETANLPPHPVLEKLKAQNEYNPSEFNLNTKGARYFVIKSYSEDDIHRSIKYQIWCSTDHGNKRLDNAFKEREGKGPVYLFYSVNGSGHFCGVAQMMSNVDYHKSSGVWAQDKWKGQFSVKWIYVKDVPNSQLRHIRLENNDNKPVTNSRDTQEVPSEKGRQVLFIMHKFAHTTSIFDDFVHYEKRQEEESDCRKGKESDEEGDAEAPEVA